MRTSSLLAATLLLASASVAQTLVGIPAHGRNYAPGFSRGYNFTANTAFDIVQLELPPEAFVAGDTGSYLIVVNGTERFRQVGVAPGTNGAATVSASVLIVPGDDVNIIGNWSTAPTGNFTANNSYGATNAPYATTIEGVAHTLNRGGWQWDVGDAAYTSGTLLAPGTGEIGRVLMYTAPPSGNIPPALEMVSETVPGSGTLGADDGTFWAGDTIRWNYNDFSGNNTGAFAQTVLNVGLGGAPAIGVTPQISGWNQLSSLSTPIGIADFFGPSLVGVGLPDVSVTVPAGLFNNGDVIRFQALVLDASSSNALPVNAMFNTISFTATAPAPTCTITEGFEGIATGVGNYPTGWSNGGGTYEWGPNTGGTTSATTGPSAAFEASQYMYCETSAPVVSGDTFILNSDTYTDQTVTQLSFYLSQIGSDIGQLDVLLNDGTTTTTIASYTGPDPAQSQGGTEWSLKTITLPALPASYSFQFVYTTPPLVSATFYGDIALDRFCLGN